ncbi:hypothetical protein ACFQL0_03860 [Haloplanus litoreus]|uniref:hypothetical protein n=1 Tax=Haloplanus litoreus TaxID=767515 RepID=UPI0036064302
MSRRRGAGGRPFAARSAARRGYRGPGGRLPGRRGTVPLRAAVGRVGAAEAGRGEERGGDDEGEDGRERDRCSPYSTPSPSPSTSGPLDGAEPAADPPPESLMTDSG